LNVGAWCCGCGAVPGSLDHHTGSAAVQAVFVGGLIRVGVSLLSRKPLTLCGSAEPSTAVCLQ
jgi:hypothetical protein